MSSTPELRWNLGYGYMRLRLSSHADAMKVLVLLSHHAQGFTYTQGGDGIIWAKTLTGSSSAMKALQKAGYIDPKQWL